ncbi:MAG: hypothetical protein R2820_06905 [Cyclobacteriaceae bacterium]|nr:hypothetical protein [Cyclobacteriaceae bacterium]
MSSCLCISIIFLSCEVVAQRTDWATEFQSSFIDISGLFGLDEPAQVIAMRYQNGGIFLDGFHSFSWKEPGKTIQTFFSGGYGFYADSLRRWHLSIGNGFAFNRVAANGSFLRPVATVTFNSTSVHSFALVSWMFLDTRRSADQPLNGATGYFGYILRLPLPKFEFRNEIRLLYSHVEEIRNVAGVTNQVKLTENKTKLYVILNTGYSFYRSDRVTEFVWNVGAGVKF